ncbi:hypothetical protein EVC12_050 [Rhizobium phage RHph_I42]|nr:hypothetical protein EVC12_050 [Rhizobium phage RHph_I42]
MNIIEAMALISAPRARRLDTPRCVYRPSKPWRFVWFDTTIVIGGKPFGFMSGRTEAPLNENTPAHFDAEDFAADDWEEIFPLGDKTKIKGVKE